MINNDEVLRFLNDRSGAQEASAVHTYRVWINERDVTVNLFDHGPGTGALRYSAEAHWSDLAEDDREPNANGSTTGNPDSTVEMALFNLHWNVFGSM